ncbi:MAG: hypothetical protein OEY00_02160 [Gammaproteobacteria bacterium]|nr:hypothetical protein [Gammaproteobacteria bacterium]
MGGSLMLLLLLYPMRKKMRVMQSWGSVKPWFKAHMIMGVVGPVMILFHSNFSLGSANSTLAMLAMIVVASSGLIGRFFYAKIHYGLYGRHANLEELKEHLNINKGKLGKRLRLGDELITAMQRYEASCLTHRGIILSLLRLPVVMVLSRIIYFRITSYTNKIIKRYAEKKGLAGSEYRDLKRKAKKTIKIYIQNVKQLSGFTAYVRLFSIWHYLHYPLFVMLVLTGIVHVFVVHLY